MENFTTERNNYRRKLIMLVKQHPILWNKTQQNYNRNRPQKILAWHQIANQLEISVDKLRRTWENLRDQYRRDLKREVRFGFKSKWRFFSDMNFIRTMVTCKEFKGTEFTDSESEDDVTDNQQQLHTQYNPISTTLVAPIAIPSKTTPSCRSTIPSSSTICPANSLPFQPIVLRKQWQSLAEDIPQSCNNPATTSYCVTGLPTPINHLEYPNNTNTIPYENVPKQEPDLELELHSAAAAAAIVEQYKHAPTKDNEKAKEFQEPCVSTSCHNRSRISIEEISHTPPNTSHSQTKPEMDLNVKDDDYYFVMSLLPSLRQIPKNRKFPLRISIMNLIAKELREVCKE